jgi:hypothetical protein
MKVHHILFLLWLVVFTGWAIKEVRAHNRRQGYK